MIWDSDIIFFLFYDRLFIFLEWKIWGPNKHKVYFNLDENERNMKNQYIHTILVLIVLLWIFGIYKVKFEIAQPTSSTLYTKPPFAEGKDFTSET